MDYFSTSDGSNVDRTLRMSPAVKIVLIDCILQTDAHTFVAYSYGLGQLYQSVFVNNSLAKLEARKSKV